jgi:hypothetical protein
MSSSYSTPSSQQQRPAAAPRPPRDPQPIIFSVCIPRVFKNITEKRVRAIFYKLRLGFVERVDMVAKTNEKGDEFWRVFVHFSNWNDKNQHGVQMRHKLEAGDKVKIVYDNPWYWMVSLSKSQRPEQHGSKRPAPFIDFDHTPAAPVEAPMGRHQAPPSPYYAPSSPDYAPPSPVYTPHSPNPDQSRPPRSDAMVPPLRCMTSAPGDSEDEDEETRRQLASHGC